MPPELSTALLALLVLLFILGKIAPESAGGFVVAVGTGVLVGWPVGAGPGVLVGRGVGDGFRPGPLTTSGRYILEANGVS